MSTQKKDALRNDNQDNVLNESSTTSADDSLEIIDENKPIHAEEEKSVGLSSLEPTEQLIFENIPIQTKERKKIYIIFGIVISVFVFAAITFLIMHQIKIVEVNKALELGEQSLTEGKYEEAILLFDKALSIDNKNPKAYQGKAQVYVDIKDYEKAESTLQEARRIAPDAEINLLLLEIYKKTDNTSGELGLLEETFSLLETKIAQTKDKEILIGLYDELIKVSIKLEKDRIFMDSLYQKATNQTGNQKYNQRSGNTISNITNDGFVLETADADIVCDFHNELSTFKNGVSTAISEKEYYNQKSFLNASDSWLYYSLIDAKNITSNINGIYRIKPDGSEKKQIVSTTNNDFILYNNSIYFVSESNLCSMNPDDPSSIKILKKSFLGRLVGIENGWIYSEVGSVENANTSGIYRTNVQNYDEQKIYSKAVTNLIPYNDSLYFVTDNKIIKTNSDGSDPAELLDTEIKNFGIFDNTVYYTTPNSTDDPFEIHSYNLTTNQDTLFTTLSKDQLTKDLDIASVESALSKYSNVRNIGITSSTIYLEINKGTLSFIYALDKENVDQGYLLDTQYRE